jgi:ABC-type transport system involved in cytochrome bd biosynthesis fused ATPase/permease subunit
LNAVIANARLDAKIKRERMRSNSVVRCRMIAAWSLNWIIYLLSAMVALTFGLEVFGGDATNEVPD